ncbi:uncharacterized protein FIBRA_04982 [Fibroporia radiculosa]|uniref:NYN domain-containing protein n=1 Tax=Fibroporia radiculosa TaxID=599839 RepID=J4H392_9APHY|nr:uncharacterized protein FIBRA_04982 [Fibroporia radiculosa]CCM02869.1 predicted protein [Fibroporia radiculosa]
MPGMDSVAIFWDYENCALPSNISGNAVANKIRQIAHKYGSVKVFKAYLELPEQSSPKSVALRSELQLCGVSLIDCPHNGRKDVADKMMIVDMMAYAIDTPAPATIVLISGDRDFVYAVSVLCLRQYRLIVFAPTVAHTSLKSQASVVYAWPADVLPESAAPRRASVSGTSPPESSRMWSDGGGRLLPQPVPASPPPSPEMTRGDSWARDRPAYSYSSSYGYALGPMGSSSSSTLVNTPSAESDSGARAAHDIPARPASAAVNVSTVIWTVLYAHRLTAPGGCRSPRSASRGRAPP